MIRLAIRRCTRADHPTHSAHAVRGVAIVSIAVLGIATLLQNRTLGAQEAKEAPRELERQPIRGTALDLEGKPWAGATIRLWAMPLRNRSFGTRDVVETETDARGRFRARLMPDRLYSVIAFERVQGKDG